MIYSRQPKTVKFPGDRPQNDVDMPRRSCLEHITPAETALREAMVQVETIGAHEKLTKAITLLGEARELVADYLEQDAPLENPDLGIR